MGLYCGDCAVVVGFGECGVTMISNFAVVRLLLLCGCLFIVHPFSERPEH